MLDDPTLDCDDCGRILRHLSPSEAQKVARNPYNFIAYCTTCQKAREGYMEGLCACCFTMRLIRMGEIRCDSCLSTGGPRDLDPEPYPRKSGPNSLPEE